MRSMRSIRFIMDVVLLALDKLLARDLARVSQTCKGLRDAVVRIKTARCADVSKETERIPVPVNVTGSRCICG